MQKHLKAAAEAITSSFPLTKASISARVENLLRVGGGLDYVVTKRRRNYINFCF